MGRTKQTTDTRNEAGDDKKKVHHKRKGHQYKISRAVLKRLVDRSININDFRDNLPKTKNDKPHKLRVSAHSLEHLDGVMNEFLNEFMGDLANSLKGFKKASKKRGTYTVDAKILKEWIKQYERAPFQSV